MCRKPPAGAGAVAHPASTRGEASLFSSAMRPARAETGMTDCRRLPRVLLWHPAWSLLETLLCVRRNSLLPTGRTDTHLTPFGSGLEPDCGSILALLTE